MLQSMLSYENLKTYCMKHDLLKRLICAGLFLILLNQCQQEHPDRFTYHLEAMDGCTFLSKIDSDSYGKVYILENGLEVYLDIEQNSAHIFNPVPGKMNKMDMSMSNELIYYLENYGLAKTLLRLKNDRKDLEAYRSRQCSNKASTT